jgi:hypothetical protein
VPAFDIELEVLPAAISYSVGIIPWSPLQGGLLGGVLKKEREGRRLCGRAQETLGIFEVDEADLAGTDRQSRSSAPASARACGRYLCRSQFRAWQPGHGERWGIAAQIGAAWRGGQSWPVSRSKPGCGWSRSATATTDASKRGPDSGILSL